MKITKAEYEQAKLIIKLFKEQNEKPYKINCDALGNIYNDDGKAIQKPRYAPNGRPQMIVCIKGKKIGVASIIANKYVKNPKGLPRLIFKDNNPLNCASDNLCWVSNEIFYLNTKVKHPEKCPMGKGMKPMCERVEVAISKAKDADIKRYYETKDERILHEVWNRVNSEIKLYNWHLVSSECYLYFIDRCQRNSFFGNPIAYFTFVAQKKLKTLNQTLNTSLAKQAKKIDRELIRSW